MKTKLERIAGIAKGRPKEKFISLMHNIDIEMLMSCHRQLKDSKASGYRQDKQEK